MTGKMFAISGIIASLALGFASCTKNTADPKLPPLLSAEEEAVVCDKTEKPDLDYRHRLICEIKHPKQFNCDLPTVPWEAFRVVRVDNSGYPGYSFWPDHPRSWRPDEWARRPQISDGDKPIGKLQQGNEFWLVYRLKGTSRLVVCSIYSGEDSESRTDIADCDIKHRTPKENCDYSETIMVGR